MCKFAFAAIFMRLNIQLLPAVVIHWPFRPKIYNPGPTISTPPPLQSTIMELLVESQKALGETARPLRNLDLDIAILRDRASSIATFPAAGITQRGECTRLSRTSMLIARIASSFQLSLKSKRLLALFSQLTFCSLGRELRRRVRSLQLLDSLQQTLGLVSRLAQIVLEVRDGFVPALDLALQILHRAIDGADTASFGRARLLQVLELRFKLCDGQSGTRRRSVANSSNLPLGSSHARNAHPGFH